MVQWIKPQCGVPTSHIWHVWFKSRLPSISAQTSASCMWQTLGNSSCGTLRWSLWLWLWSTLALPVVGVPGWDLGWVAKMSMTHFGVLGLDSWLPSPLSCRSRAWEVADNDSRSWVPATHRETWLLALVHKTRGHCVHLGSKPMDESCLILH